MLYDDTIVAIATPPGEGGLGVVRFSGPESLAILEAMFRPIRAGRWRPFRLRLGHVLDVDGGRIDEALAVVMRGPRSFTGEDVVELSCHGGSLVLARVLGRALGCGARHANPGEFTMRAFLNGRMDLAQAEATLDVINAQTTTSLALAQAQLGGWLSQELQRARALLLNPLAYCTVLVDFPEDEVEAQPIVEPMREASTILGALLRGSDQGIVYRQGARAAIVGQPNAGKSSLLNALLRIDRAIVTPIPGTTRDTLEETANLAGVPVVLIDTAGITESLDVVERIGIERSRSALAGSDLALLVVDASPPEVIHANGLDHILPEAEVVLLTRGKPTILVLNKIDLPGSQEQTAYLIESLANQRQEPFVAIALVSAREGIGISELGQQIAQVLLGGVDSAGTQLVTNPRHREALRRAVGHVADGLNGYDQGIPHDLLAIDLTAALHAIDEITGKAIGEDLLNEIFSRFCIGK